TLLMQRAIELSANLPRVPGNLQRKQPPVYTCPTWLATRCPGEFAVRILPTMVPGPQRFILPANVMEAVPAVPVLSIEVVEYVEGSEANAVRPVVTGQKDTIHRT